MRKKSMPTRRRRAVRQIGAAVLLLVVMNVVWHTYYLFPAQNLWTVEEAWGCGRTEVLKREWSGGRLWYLTENENAVLLLAQEPSFTGWRSAGANVLDCSGDSPVHSGFLRAEGWCAFGRVDDPAVASVQLTVYDGLQTTDTQLAGDEDWFWRDGQRYFLLRSGAETRRAKLTALDREGKVLMDRLS